MFPVRVRTRCASLVRALFVRARRCSVRAHERELTNRDAHLTRRAPLLVRFGFAWRFGGYLRLDPEMRNDRKENKKSHRKVKSQSRPGDCAPSIECSYSRSLAR